MPRSSRSCSHADSMASRMRPAAPPVSRNSLARARRNVDPEYARRARTYRVGLSIPMRSAWSARHLTRQPRLASTEARASRTRTVVAAASATASASRKVNERNFAKYGLDEATMFEPCRNLQAGGAILTECFARSSGTGRATQAALRAALSCYYSGNFTTGFSSGYVSRVVASAQRNAREGGVEPIPVVSDTPPARQRRMDAVATTPPDRARRLHVAGRFRRRTVVPCAPGRDDVPRAAGESGEAALRAVSRSVTA
ncbi:hypothetical protein BCPG_05090 [Burkholderia cenocepacia PC184]|nr:hypothetical protein BCPG_05090 [Burkholderia cenocepacia PC184]